MDQNQLNQESNPQKKALKGTKLKSYFFAGLLVWLPILACVGVVQFLIALLDRTVEYLPAHYRPEVLFGVHIPGMGVVISLLVVLLTGLAATNFLGRWFVRMWEYILSHIPFVRTIYKAVKQVLETLFSTGNDSFRRVFLVQYPRPGMWAICFQTGNSKLPTDASKELKEMYTIFVPTTPNPTSGFLMMVPREDVIELDISVDEAVKLIISLGVVQPEQIPAKLKN